MAYPKDFRLVDFDLPKVTVCGTFLGHRFYWKLYAFENIVRIVVHSVLSVEIGTSWWQLAVDRTIQRTVEALKAQYAKGKSNPGKHQLYYVSLGDLNEIIRVNANLIRPYVLDIDDWLVRVEALRLPRNLIAHMNFPVGGDFKIIDELYTLSPSLISALRKSKVKPLIP